MWQAKRLSPRESRLITEAIIGKINEHATELIQKWGQENAPPPAHLYSLENVLGGNLHVIQKTFQGDFEVFPFVISN